MKRLNKTPDDVAFLKDLLEESKAVKAIYHYFFFKNTFADSLKEATYNGEVSDLDEESKTAVFTSEQGWSMIVNINMITIV